MSKTQQNKPAMPEPTPEEEFFDEGLGQFAIENDEGDMGPVNLSGAGSRRTSSQYTTAQHVIKPRDSARVAARLKEEARRSGVSFFYGWGAGKNKVLGPSVKLAQAALRCYGNAALEMGEIQETEDAWIMTAYFIDLETGFTAARQFRMSKHWTIHGKFDQERKIDMRFQIGQSKAIRNVIINNIPDWMIRGAMQEAMAGVRETVLKFIKAKGIATAQKMILDALKKHGIEEGDILAKCGISETKAMDSEMIVMLRGDLHALDNGMDHAEQLFPAIEKRKAEAAGRQSDANAAFGDEGNDPEAVSKLENSSSPPTPKAKVENPQ